MKRTLPLLALSLALASAGQSMAAATGTKVLGFEQAIKLAQKSDPWLTGNRHQQTSLEALSIAAGTLPDPKVSVGLANLATDSLQFDQEGMTQLKVGVAQMFPRGDSLAIKRQQLSLQSQQFPFQRQDREAKVAVTVGSLWLDAYRVQQSIALIEKNRSLFEQLTDVAQASYSSALGKTRQQDVVRAQLELTRLEDRLNRLNQQKNRFSGQLSRWLNAYFGADKLARNWQEISEFHNINLGNGLPQVELLNKRLVYGENWLTAEQLVPYFSKHPAVMALEKKIDASKTGIRLAKQKYQPEWGLNASYAYRDDDPMGNSRSDLFSVGVTFDLPLFTENRQDQQVKSAVSQAEAVKTEKLLLLRQLLGAYSSAKGRLLKLNERKALYEKQLLPQIHDQAEASLTAYTNDDGDFAEVVRARIAELNAEIDQLMINVEQQKIILELNYLFITGKNVSGHQTSFAGDVK